MEKSINFERSLVDEIICLAAAKGMNLSQFARKAFPDSANPETKWRQIRNAGPQGDPLKFTIRDAFTCAKALGMDLASLVFRVQEKIRINDMLNEASNDDRPTNPEISSSPGPD